MNNVKLRNLTIMLLAVTILGSCSKEKIYETRINTLETLVEIANQEYLGTGVSGGDDQHPFLVINDGLIEEYLTKENHFEDDDAGIRNKLIGCLRSVNPDVEQIPQIKSAIRAFEHRNARIIQKHRDDFQQLRQRVEYQRNELIRQLLAGEIDQPEFRRKMAQLRQHFQNGLQRIKESNAEAFSRSYRMLMQQINNILNDYQWIAFADCLRL